MENLNELLLTSIHVSIEAGFRIMEVFHNKIHISIKRNLTPVTNADKLANEIIVNKLQPFNIPIISEESKNAPYEERRKWEYCILIDPLDGTKEFIARRDEFTVNIALIHNNKPIMGVIYAPAMDLLYFAAPDFGSYRLRNASAIINEATTIESILANSTALPDITTATYTYLVSRSHVNHKTRKYLKTIKGDKEYIHKGSSLKLCAIAEGSANEYPRFGKTMEWDIAAGDAILSYAGGKVQIYEGAGLLTYNKADLGNPEFIASR